MESREAKRAANKFSRQNAALGAETTKFLGRMRLMVVGLRGVGVEVCKNCLLQGVSQLVVYDPTPVAIADVGCNFFLSAEDVGRPRAEVCVPRLQELNPEASISSVEEVSEGSVGSCSCVVFCGDALGRSELLRWNEFCRSRRVETVDERGSAVSTAAAISFVWVACRGASCSVFVDHGERFEVRDANGERPVVRLVESISSEAQGLVRYVVPDGVAATSVPLQSLYQLTEVVGCDGACEAPWRVSRRAGDPANSFRIGDTRGLPGYVSGGVITEVKAVEARRFESLASRLRDPGSAWADGGGMAATDYTFAGQEAQLHAALVGLLEFQATQGRLPRPNDEADADGVVANAKRYAEACAVVNRGAGRGALELEGGVDDAFARAFARHAAVELQPVACFAGGVAAQEVVKCGGKYSPIDGFAHFCFFEALPTPPPPLATNRAFFPSFPCDDSAFATALVAAFDRTWMCFVRFTTSAKSSSAFPSMTPREFQTNIDDRSSASEKICESSDWVRLVDPSPSVSTNSTVVPSSSETGVPHSHNPLVHAFTVAPT
mmetsp:Transcript_8478/g.26441  ORF Transcript_8478/g.26441 Transcript_8478/m.26441 type:complete len:550 (-) Transcript_8478:4-1653(-)